MFPSRPMTFQIFLYALFPSFKSGGHVPVVPMLAPLLARKLNYTSRCRLLMSMPHLEKQLVFHDSLNWFNEHVRNLQPMSKL